MTKITLRRWSKEAQETQNGALCPRTEKHFLLSDPYSDDCTETFGKKDIREHGGVQEKAGKQASTELNLFFKRFSSEQCSAVVSPRVPRPVLNSNMGFYWSSSTLA